MKLKIELLKVQDLPRYEPQWNVFRVGKDFRAQIPRR